MYAQEFNIQCHWYTDGEKESYVFYNNFDSLEYNKEGAKFYKGDRMKSQILMSCQTPKTNTNVILDWLLILDAVD